MGDTPGGYGAVFEGGGELFVINMCTKDQLCQKIIEQIVRYLQRNRTKTPILFDKTPPGGIGSPARTPRARPTPAPTPLRGVPAISLPFSPIPAPPTP